MANRIITSYTEALRMARGGRARKLANNTLLIENDDGSFGVQLHSTQVVVFHADGRIVLDSGGYTTTTTKRRMNAALADTPYTVFQRDFAWYLGRHTANGWVDLDFVDGMVFFDERIRIG